MASSEKSTGAIKKRQKRMGPAPIASFEDLSDDKSKIESTPEEQNLAGSVVRLPGIREDLTPHSPRSTCSPLPTFTYPGISLVGSQMHSTSPQHLKSPRAPRIDISRASSSSHHGSRDSTPDKEGYEHDPHSAKLGLGFREDGALDLRSSTEELPYHGKHRKSTHSRSPSIHDEFHRKDSQSSELLEVVGRSSRVSSIGSQGSANSRISNLSAYSYSSRCSSPYKMVLETSFCGNKTPDKAKPPTDLSNIKIDPDLEKALLSRKHDPTKAILAEGIATPKKVPQKPARKEMQAPVDIKITIDHAQKNGLSKSSPAMSRNVSANGVEYFYIPLKGKLPEDVPGSQITVPKFNKRTLRECKSASPVERRKNQLASPNKRKKGKGDAKVPTKRSASALETSTRKSNEPQIIRIRLKPDHMYEDEPESPRPVEIHKPDSLDLQSVQYEAESTGDSGSTHVQSSPSVSPKNSRSNVVSVTPSPTASRRSSFASIFRSRESTPESPGGRRLSALSGFVKEATDQVSKHLKHRPRSNSKDASQTLSAAPSSSESIDSKTKQKSLLSLFKFGKSIEPPSPKRTEPDVKVEEGIGKVEFKFNDTLTSDRDHKKFPATPLVGRIIHIPLHSPTYYTERTIAHDWSQESQDTVIENNPKDEISIETKEDEDVQQVEKIFSKESSTSSENFVFTTQLGNNEVFTTKLPKRVEETNHTVDIIVHEASSPVDIDDNGNKQEELSREPFPKTIEQSPQTSIEPVESIIEPIENTCLPKDTSLSNLVTVEASLSSLSLLDVNSSDSEKDSEADSLRNNRKSQVLKLKLSEQEIKGLVQDSFEEELPYVPTTLPQERSSVVPIVPISQRSSFDIKTCTIERPRSTTPLNPSCLEEYCEEVFGYVESVAKTIEKIKISLPKTDSFDKMSKKSPRINWQEFAEIGKITRTTPTAAEEPPPLPPKGMQKEWIDFEQIPEKRRHPKRIQTIPGRDKDKLHKKVSQDGVVYNYVNPDECVCECHDHITAKPKAKPKEPLPQPMDVDEEEELMPLLDEEATIEPMASTERFSNISESSSSANSKKTIQDRKSSPSGSKTSFNINKRHEGDHCKKDET
ncbi:unnamed protein product [Brassicogethes aeneus]|uniref:Uncharacterized protein n=1 Tax=Brassicogethes aeneus TaxID=1431903 RepID=A0A9P0BEC3_BRAAE|nr:unnamed protein product [Brassicogethes aeneus]